MLDARGFTYGLAIGAGTMFLLDPARGAARRARLRDGSRRVVHDAEHFVEVGARDLENRTHGVGARARSFLRRASEDELSEDVIVARVRSRLGRATSHAHAIEVRFKEGNEIELKGPALATEHDRIVRAASRVRGVHHIDDDLVVYENADGVAGLQGNGEHAAGASGTLRLRPAGSLLATASVAAALLTPLAPTLVMGVIYGITRSLLLSPASPSRAPRSASGSPAPSSAS